MEKRKGKNTEIKNNMAEYRLHMSTVQYVYLMLSFVTKFFHVILLILEPVVPQLCCLHERNE